MKKYISITLMVLLLVCINVSGQTSHLGVLAEIPIPITPLSKGYKPGYGAGIMYRNFRMTKTFFWDAKFAYSKINVKQELSSNVTLPYYPYQEPSGDINSIMLMMGINWAFIPNGSPYTQPYIGLESGLYMSSEARLSSYNQAAPLGVRLGWMSYINERFLLGLESKYMAVLDLGINNRENAGETAIGGQLDHFISLQLSANIRIGQ